MPPTPIQNLIIGSGEGGKFLAWHLAQSNQPTVLIERRWIGGSCPNTNCLPSKNEIWSAKVADLLHHADHFGLKTAPPTFDLAAVRQRKRDMVAALVKIHVDRYKFTGVNLIMGSARLTAPRTVEVSLKAGGTRTFLADRLFLNLGTHATIPPIPGLADSKPLTHIEILELDQLPEHLIILGGGYVGLEFAQAYRRFGSRVTILHHAPHLLAHNDPDVIAEVSRILSADGITTITSADVQSVQGLSGSSVTLTANTPAGPVTLQGTHLLVSTGRSPNTSNIGLDLAGVQLDPHGYIQVNNRLETTSSNVFAIGECAGSPQFTHVSFDDFRILRDNLAGGNRTTTGRLIPSCLFIDPPLAHIGLSETEAARRNIPYRLAKIPAAAVLRTRTLDETQGFLKALIDPANNHILGFTMLAPEAGEVLAVVQTAMLANLPYTTLRDAIFAHPTMAEGLNVLFSSPPEIARAQRVRGLLMVA